VGEDEIGELKAMKKKGKRGIKSSTVKGQSVFTRSTHRYLRKSMERLKRNKCRGTSFVEKVLLKTLE